MFIRILSSAPLGMAMTASLLYLMNLLIVIGPGPEMIDRTPIPLIFGRSVIDTKTAVDDPPPKHISPPEPPPRNRQPQESSTDSTSVGTRHLPPPVPNPGPASVTFGFSDGPLVNVIKVTPVYPITAKHRELEGYVIVRFDVAATGLVENVSVIDSSHKEFHRSAVNAVMKFRYKPRMVDGEAVAVSGLQYKFRYQMERPNNRH